MMNSSACDHFTQSNDSGDSNKLVVNNVSWIKDIILNGLNGKF